MLKIPNYEVIFLDLDGVLHPVDAVEHEFFSESCVFALRRLLDSCNAQVVLSSTWSSGLKVMECQGKNGTQHGFGEKGIFMIRFGSFWLSDSDKDCLTSQISKACHPLLVDTS